MAWWWALVTFAVGGFVGMFLCGIMRDGKLSDLAVEAEYYKRLAGRKKRE